MDEDKSWVCCECGTVNGGEYEICYKCGAVRRDVNISVPTDNAEKKHNEKPHAKQTGRKREKKAHAPVLVIIAVAAVVFVLVSAWLHVSAQKYAAAGRYGAAAAMAKFDLLFSSELKESAWIEKGRELYESGDYAEALEYLKDFADSEEGGKLLDLSNLKLAYEYLDRGDYDAAIEFAEKVTGEGIDLAGLLDDAYFTKGMDALREMSLSKAKSAFDKVVNDGLAADYAKILDGLDSGNYISAAALAAERAGYDNDHLYLSQWYDIFAQEMETADAISTDKNMQMHAALRLLADDWDFADERCPSYSAPVDQAFDVNDRDHTLIPFDDLQSFGSNENGKVVVLWEIHKYGTDEVVYYIDWSAMEDLPKELYPQSLAEVGRSIRIVCSGRKEGWYTVGDKETDAVREYSNVYAGAGDNGGWVYSSPTIWGAGLPKRAMIYDPDKPVFGGINDLSNNKNISEYIYKAMRKLVL